MQGYQPRGNFGIKYDCRWILKQKVHFVLPLTSLFLFLSEDFRDAFLRRRGYLWTPLFKWNSVEFVVTNPRYPRQSQNTLASKSSHWSSQIKPHTPSSVITSTRPIFGTPALNGTIRCRDLSHDPNTHTSSFPFRHTHAYSFRSGINLHKWEK